MRVKPIEHPLKHERILYSHASASRTGQHCALQVLMNNRRAVHILKMENNGSGVWALDDSELLNMGHHQEREEKEEERENRLQIQWSKRCFSLAARSSSACNLVGCRSAQKVAENQERRWMRFLFGVPLLGQDAHTLKRPLSSSSTMFSPRLPMKRVLQGGLSFIFCRTDGR